MDILQPIKGGEEAVSGGAEAGSSGGGGTPTDYTPCMIMVTGLQNGFGFLAEKDNIGNVQCELGESICNPTAPEEPSITWPGSDLPPLSTPEELLSHLEDEYCSDGGCEISIDPGKKSVTLKKKNGETFSSEDFDEEMLSHPKAQAIMSKALGSSNDLGGGLEPQDITIEEEVEEEDEKEKASSQTPMSSGDFVSSEAFMNTDESSGGYDAHSSGLLEQFQKLKSNRKIAKSIENSKSFKKDKIGIAEDNIFMMVHKRYQKHRKANSFIEGFSS